MRYSQLNFVVCPRCHGELTSVTLAERPCEVPRVGLAPFDRVPTAGALVGPVPSPKERTLVADVLSGLSGAAAPPERNYEVVLETGILACGACEAWYPVIRAVPELLPDHLRDWKRDRDFLESVSVQLPAALVSAWRRFEPPQAATDDGAHYKQAEIALPAKIADPTFWGPGYASPFNLWDSKHTWHLIRDFALAQPLLELEQWQAVLDVGSGYSWTTEWLLRSGHEAIGIDLCRAYLEIGLARVGPNRPHLLIADAEHLPIRSAAVRAVLAFEAFHHVPDRAAAMREFGRVLAEGCPVVLVEPGAEHEYRSASVDAMQKYGTLEKGMELADVETYARGSGLGSCRQHHLARTAVSLDGRRRPSGGAASAADNHVFTLRKGRRLVGPAARRLRSRLARRFWRAAVWLRRAGRGARTRALPEVTTSP